MIDYSIPVTLLSNLKSDLILILSVAQDLSYLTDESFGGFGCFKCTELRSGRIKILYIDLTQKLSYKQTCHTSLCTEDS